MCMCTEEHDDTINEDNQDDGIVVEEEMETIDLRRVMTKFVATLHVCCFLVIQLWFISLNLL